jgi:hypothetical protein
MKSNIKIIDMELEGSESKQAQSTTEQSANQAPEAAIVKGSRGLSEKAGKAELKSALEDLDPDEAIRALEARIEQGVNISEDEVKQAQVVLDKKLDGRVREIESQFDELRDKSKISDEHTNLQEQTLKKIQQTKKEATDSALEVVEGRNEIETQDTSAVETEFALDQVAEKLPENFVKKLAEKERLGMREIFDATLSFENSNPEEAQDLLLKAAFAFKFSTEQIVNFSEKLPEGSKEDFFARMEIPNIPDYESLSEKERYEMSFGYYREQGVDQKLNSLNAEIEQIKEQFGDKQTLSEKISKLKEELTEDPGPDKERQVEKAEKKLKELSEAVKERELLSRTKIFRLGKDALVEKFVENKESIESRIEQITAAKNELYNVIADVLEEELKESQSKGNSDKVAYFRKRLENLKKTKKKEQSLRSGIIGESELGGGVNRTKAVKLKNNTLPGVYKPRIGESYLGRNGFPPNETSGFMEREILAHGVDQIFGLDVVPTTIAVNGSDGLGALSEWVPSVPAVQTQEKGLGDWSDGDETKLQAVGLKDFLTNNVDGHREDVGKKPDGGYAGIDNGMIAPKRLGKPDLVRKIRSGELDPKSLDPQEYSGIDFQDNLRSAPLEVVGGKSLDQNLLNNIQLFQKHKKLESATRVFFETLLGDEEGFAQFRQLREKVRDMDEQAFNEGEAQLPSPDLDSKTINKLADAGLLGEVL